MGCATFLTSSRRRFLLFCLSACLLVCLCACVLVCLLAFCNKGRSFIFTFPFRSEDTYIYNLYGYTRILLGKDGKCTKCTLNKPSVYPSHELPRQTIKSVLSVFPERRKRSSPGSLLCMSVQNLRVCTISD